MNCSETLSYVVVCSSFFSAPPPPRLLLPLLLDRLLVGVAVREPRLLDAGFVVVADLIVDLLDLGGLLLDEDKVLLLFVVVALIDLGLSAVPEETAALPDVRLGEIGMFSPVGFGL